MTKRFPNRIVVDQNIMVGKPVVFGTRITVEQILRQLAQGMTNDEILENYPQLTREDIYAVLEYATEAIEDETVYSLSSINHGRSEAIA